MVTTECPNCDILVEISSPVNIGDLVRCNSCHESLMVVWTDPVELDWPYDDEEFDWDEDYEEEGSW